MAYDQSADMNSVYAPKAEIVIRSQQGRNPCQAAKHLWRGQWPKNQY